MDARSPARLAPRLRPGLVAIVHVNADPDAIGSAYALARAYGGTVAAPGGVAVAGRRLAMALRLDVGDALPDGPQRVLVDAASAAQFRPWESQLAPFLLVDHHAEADLAGAAEVACVVPRSSCAEVVLEVLDAAGRPPDALGSLGLLAALAADTGRFRFADTRTFEAASRLLAACGRPWASVVEIIEGDEDEDATR
ncbi:MAG TPA: DHH family phosphoesterase, partial [Candidatus Thermoplasmatota archaeon]|nr:DHH family phosphoesterase [Candidatus Thermoplasmatota archaeon]